MALPRLRNLLTGGAVGTAIGLWCYQDARSPIHDYFILPLARFIFPDGEDAHLAGVKLMRVPWLNPRLPSHWLESVDPDHKLEVRLFENSPNPRVRRLTLPTPIGIAAGLDKNGEDIATLFRLGFSWVEVGSITPEPQPGNPRPRVFRLGPDNAIVNRYGFNSDGHFAVLARIEMWRSRNPITPKGVLAVNLGKNKTGDEISDYVRGIKSFGPVADALVVNVSSPNTPGLRDLQSDEKLRKLLKVLVTTRDALPGATVPPLLVKIAPDLGTTEIREIAAAVKDTGVDGIIAGNTTIGRPSSLKSPKSLCLEKGGLSGPPVKPITLDVLKQLRQATGPDVTIVGCGGISNAKDALEYGKSGANFVQLYTAFAYNGPGTPALMTEALSRELGDESWSNIAGK